MRKLLKGKLSIPRMLRGGSLKLIIRHILVLLDLSSFARQALTGAVQLAREHRARLNLLPVIQSPTGSTWRAIPRAGLYLAMNRHIFVNVPITHRYEQYAHRLPGNLSASIGEKPEWN